MSYRMWKGRKSNDYSMIDRLISEQYVIGGVDAWLYTYKGAKKIPNNNDLTKNVSLFDNNPLSNIGDVVFGETSLRDYNVEALVIPVVYSVQEATPDLKLVAIFFNYETMDITVHYNTMMQIVGRKIIPGDVLELPNLRDEDVLGKDSGLNKFYVVHDAFKTSEGYSATWLNHIYKLRVKPLTDSPEFDDLFVDNEYPDNPDDPNNGNGNDGDNPNSNNENEMNIINAILKQTDNEMPYIHWTNEHIYNDTNPDMSKLNFDDIISGETYPVPKENMLFVKKEYPKLFVKENTWVELEATYGNELPKSPEDMDFFFLENSYERSGYSLYQYSTEESTWISCDISYFTEEPQADMDFYVLYHLPVLYQYTNGAWVKADFTKISEKINTPDIRGNLSIPHDWREAIPPARGDVPEGEQFPSSPSDGDYFYRSDFIPVTLWQFNADKNKWVQFNYGGRLPWVGANYQRVKFVNAPDEERVSVNDVVKPNTLYRKYKK